MTTKTDTVTVLFEDGEAVFSLDAARALFGYIRDIEEDTGEIPEMVRFPMSKPAWQHSEQFRDFMQIDDSIYEHIRAFNADEMRFITNHVLKLNPEGLIRYGAYDWQIFDMLGNRCMPAGCGVYLLMLIHKRMDLLKRIALEMPGERMDIISAAFYGNTRIRVQFVVEDLRVDILEQSREIVAYIAHLPGFDLIGCISPVISLACKSDIDNERLTTLIRSVA